MAGTSIEIDLQIQEVHDAFNRLIQAGQNLDAPMREIAEFLNERTRDHFDKEESPDGEAWAPLASSTIEARQKQGVPVNRILHGKSLHLRDTIFPFYSEDEAGVSSGPATQKYAALHQFGADNMSIQIPQHNRRIESAFGKPLKFPVIQTVSARTATLNVPARPFIGIGSEDEDEILGILKDFLSEAF